MRISVTCPSCHKNGTLPDAMRGQRIKCAGCHEPFVVTASKSEAQPPPRSRAAVLADDDSGAYDVQPLRRRVPPQSHRSASASTSAPGNSAATTVYAGLGIGGVCGLIMALAMLLTVSGQPAKPKAGTEPKGIGGPADRPDKTPPAPQSAF